MGSGGFTCKEALDRSWTAMLAHARGHASREQVDNATHYVFTDYAAIAPQLQAAGLMSAHNRTELVGAIDPAVSVPTVRNRVLSFFARHLPSH